MKHFIHLIPIALLLWGCGSDDAPTSLFEPKPECDGAAIAPLMSQTQLVMSFLEVGTPEQGFDLDDDGEPDNALGVISSLVRPAIGDALEDFSLLLPMEFFDYDQAAADDCVKFAVYLGRYRLDGDGDDNDTANDDGDCNDLDSAINKNAAEVLGNRKDDNCDGNADEEIIDDLVVTSDDMGDMDQDGVSMADGDCDDTNAMVGGRAEICGDGLDNDCDGNADFGVNMDGTPVCTPFDASPDMLELEPESFNADGSPAIAFTSGEVRDNGGTLQLEAGPSLFGLSVPLTGDIALTLGFTGTTITGDIVAGENGISIQNGRLGGVIDSHTADQIRGLEVSDIGLEEENSLLDATFANILGQLLSLPLGAPNEISEEGCRTPDIDVDFDGLEAFCDSTPGDVNQTVDVCIDGDGTIIRDEVDSEGNVITHCTDARDADGNLRFVDGISVEFNFEAVPTILVESR